jgi:fatty acid desaturase
MTDSPAHSHAEGSDETSQGHVQNFFRQYWVLVFFGTMFLLTMGMPLIFSGFLSAYAFGFLALMLIGFAMALVIPALFPVFILIAIGVVAALTPVWLASNFLAYMALVVVTLALLFFGKFVVSKT